MTRRRPLIKTDKDDRYLFYATFNGYRVSGGSRGFSQSLEFVDITDEYGNKVAEHMIFDDLKTFKKLNLVQGDEISFMARVYECNIAHEGLQFVKPTAYYRLLNPTKAQKLNSFETNNTCPIKIIPTR